MNAVLEDDLERVHRKFSEDAVKVTLFESIDGIDIEFVVQLDFLDVSELNCRIMLFEYMLKKKAQIDQYCNALR